MVEFLNEEQQKHDFLTRTTKYGRKGYLVAIFLLTGLSNLIFFIHHQVVGLAPGWTWEQEIFQQIFILIVNSLVVLFTDLSSDMSFNLFKKLEEEQVIPRENVEQINGFLWDKKVYAITIIIFLISVLFGLMNIIMGFEPLEYVFSLEFLAALIGQPVFALIFSELIWIIFSTTVTILLLPFRNWKVSLNVFSGDKAGGIHSISTYLLRISLMITLLCTTYLYWVLGPATSIYPLEWRIVALFGVLSLPLLYFIVPTIGLNRIMKKEKNTVLRELSVRLNHAYSTLTTDSSKIDSTILEQVQLVELLHTKATQMREWPFSLSGLRNLLTSFILPIGLFFLTNLQDILSLF